MSPSRRILFFLIVLALFTATAHVGASGLGGNWASLLVMWSPGVAMLPFILLLAAYCWRRSLSIDRDARRAEHNCPETPTPVLPPPMATGSVQ